MSDYWSAPSDASYSSYGHDGQPDEEPTFEVDDEFEPIMKKDMLLMLVDCGPKMQIPNEDGVTWLSRTIEAITKSLKNKIINSPSDYFGVAFFNTRQAKNDSACPGYYVLFPPEEPRAEMIKKIADLQDMRNFDKEIGLGRADRPCEIFQALWASSSVFTGAAQQRNIMKRLMIFTCDDNPCRGNSGLKEKAEKKAKDLKDIGIEITLCPLMTRVPVDDTKPIIPSSSSSSSSSSSTSSNSSSSPFTSSMSSSSSSPSTSSSSPLSTSLPSSSSIVADPSLGESFHTNLSHNSSSSLSTFTSNSTTNISPPYSTTRMDLVQPVTFRIMTFYANIIDIDDEDGADSAEIRPAETLEDLTDLLKRRLVKKRALSSMAWTVGEGQFIGVKLYCLVREAKPEYPRRLDLTDNTPLATKVKWICPSGKALDDIQMKKYFQYSTAKIVFTDDEMRQIRSFGDAGLTLLGFKPIDSVYLHHNIKNPYFLYPDDYAYPGSNIAFVALYNAMLRLHKVAVCRLITRKHSIPRLVVLIPVEERVTITPLGKRPVQSQPPGLQVVFLPYAEDLRSPPIKDPQVTIQDDLLEKAKRLTHALTIPRPPDVTHDSEIWRNRIFNPVLQHYYGILEAYALDQKEPDIRPSTLVPATVVGKAKSSIDDFVTEVDRLASEIAEAQALTAGAAGKKTTTSKRKRPEAGADQKGDGSGGAPAAPVDYAAWKDPSIMNNLASKTVPELKDYCRHFKLPLSGKKQDIIDRVTNHMKS